MADATFHRVFRWLSDYEVGVPEIDREHQGLFAIAERFHLALREGHGKQVLESHLDQLLDYACHHLAHEEALMQKIVYPHYREHCRQHEDLRIRLDELKERASAGEVSMTIEVMQFIMEWLKCHTTTSDRRIGSYMRKHGLVP
jgi:hemerythrin-like metal-binding protein